MILVESVLVRHSPSLLYYVLLIVIYHFDTSGQRKSQGYISHIALTTTAFDAKAATKHQFPLIVYIEMLKVLHCGFELNMLI